MKRSWAALYVGLQWHPYGRTRAEGVDCWGLFRLVLNEQAGIELPLYDTVPKTDFEKTIATETAIPPWQKVDIADRKPFDLVVMRTEVKDHLGRRRMANAHVGVITDSLKILHVQQGAGGTAVLQPFEDLRLRVVEILRFRGIEYAEI